MDGDTLLFFEGHQDALPLYELLQEKILEEIGHVRIKVQKSQISFYNKHLFACVSFLPVRRKKDRPDDYIVVTFGLNHRVVSSRIDVAVEPYPGRFTHHLLISCTEEIDDELVGWIKEAAVFSSLK